MQHLNLSNLIKKPLKKAGLPPVKTLFVAETLIEAELLGHRTLSLSFFSELKKKQMELGNELNE